VKDRYPDDRVRLIRVRVALVVALFTIALVLASCGAEDVTFTVQVKNDSSQVIVDRQCNITCDQFFTKVRLDPGQSTTDVESPDGVPSPDELFSPSGVVLGCLPFRFRTVPPGDIEVATSQAIGCGGSSGSTNAAGLDWPDRKY
jgi:hypothetical protein